VSAEESIYAIRVIEAHARAQLPDRQHGAKEQDQPDTTERQPTQIRRRCRGDARDVRPTRCPQCRWHASSGERTQSVHGPSSLDALLNRQSLTGTIRRVCKRMPITPRSPESGASPPSLTNGAGRIRSTYQAVRLSLRARRDALDARTTERPTRMSSIAFERSFVAAENALANWSGLSLDGVDRMAKRTRRSRRTTRGAAGECAGPRASCVDLIAWQWLVARMGAAASNRRLRRVRPQSSPPEASAAAPQFPITL
jgi:hypothetical protein